STVHHPKGRSIRPKAGLCLRGGVQEQPRPSPAGPSISKCRTSGSGSCNVRAETRRELASIRGRVSNAHLPVSEPGLFSQHSCDRFPKTMDIAIDEPTASSFDFNGPKPCPLTCIDTRRHCGRNKFDAAF